MKINNLTLTVVAAGLAAGLIGCGGSSSKSHTATYSGTVLTEGRVAGATVCLDKNDNLSCDADEPSTTTDGNGEFSIVTSATNAALVAQSADVEGVTVLVSPRLSGSIAPGTRLTAPNNAQIISLFTTLTQVRALTAGVSYAQAQQDVVTALGLPSGTDLSSLNYDAEGTDVKILAAAQTVAQLVGANLSTILSNGGATTPTATTILAFDNLFATNETGQSRLEVITQTLANTGESDLATAVNTLTQQNVIPASDIAAGLAAINDILNGVTTPSGGTGGTAG